MTSYQYIESGLDNVFIKGLSPVVDDEGDEVITIPFVAALHAEIARGIVTRNGAIRGAELRFLRTEMGMTQAELAQTVNVEGQTVGRWERDEFTVDPTAETVIRRLAGERLIEAFDRSIEELVGHVQAPTRDEAINIQVDDGGYRLTAA